MSKKVLPIKPSGVSVLKYETMPPEVIEAFNELIAANLSGGSATVRQKDVVARIVEKGIKESTIFKNGWLDVEDIYRKNGWHVSYDKPGYCETYDAYFVFSVKRSSE